MNEDTSVKPVTDDEPLVFTDGVGGPPLPLEAPPSEPSPNQAGLRRLLAGLVRKKPARPKLQPPTPPVALQPCPSCKKEIGVDLAACPFCAWRRERPPVGPVGPERVEGTVVPPALAVELAAQRERDAAFARVHRTRRIENRARMTLLGVVALVLPAAGVWGMLASPEVLRPAIVVEAVAAWILMRVLMSSRLASAPAALAAFPIITARITVLMLGVMAFEKTGHPLGALISGLKGRGAGAAFAMVAGSACLTLVTASLLKLGMELSDDDYADHGERPKDLAGVIADLSAAFQGALSFSDPEITPSAGAPFATVAPAERRVVAATSVVLLGLPGILYWLVLPLGWPWVLAPIAAELGVAGFLTWRILLGNGRFLASLAAAVRMLIAVAVAFATGHPGVAVTALILGLFALKVETALAAALEASARTAERTAAVP